jgi:hypothetical protein
MRSAGVSSFTLPTVAVFSTRVFRVVLAIVEPPTDVEVAPSQEGTHREKSYSFISNG